jgi:hypothetical protein
MDMQLKWIEVYQKWFVPHKNQVNAVDKNEKLALFQEITDARIQWSEAQARLEWAVGKDSIDYSIYALEAAEKRYEMLLRIAKQKVWDNQRMEVEKESS